MTTMTAIQMQPCATPRSFLHLLKHFDLEVVGIWAKMVLPEASQIL